MGCRSCSAAAGFRPAPPPVWRFWESTLSQARRWRRPTARCMCARRNGGMRVNMIDKKRGLVGSRSHHAIEADLDQLLFVLDADQHEAFVRILDNPPPP